MLRMAENLKTTNETTPLSSGSSFFSDFARKDPNLESYSDQSLTELNEKLEKELQETKRKYQVYLEQTLLSRNITISEEDQEFIRKIKNREIEIQRRIEEDKNEMERRRKEIAASRPPPVIESYDNETLQYIQERMMLASTNATALATVNLTIPNPEEIPGLVTQFLKDAYIGPPDPTPRQQDATFVFRSITALCFAFGFLFTALFVFFPGKFVNVGSLPEIRRQQLSPEPRREYSLQNPQNPYEKGGKNPGNPYENQLELDLNQRLSKYRIFNYDAEDRERTIIKREMQPIVTAPPPTPTLSNPESDKKILSMRENANPKESLEKAPIVMQKVKAVKIEKESIRPSLTGNNNDNTVEESTARAPPPQDDLEYIPTIQDFTQRSNRIPLQKGFLQQYLDTLKEDLKDTIDL